MNFKDYVNKHLDLLNETKGIDLINNFKKVFPFSKENNLTVKHFNIKGECVGIRCRHLNPEDVERKGKYTPIWYDNMSYAHQLSLNLYGLNKTKEAISNKKQAIIFEAE